MPSFTSHLHQVNRFDLSDEAQGFQEKQGQPYSHSLPSGAIYPLSLHDTATQRHYTPDAPSLTPTPLPSTSTVFTELYPNRLRHSSQTDPTGPTHDLYADVWYSRHWCTHKSCTTLFRKKQLQNQNCEKKNALISKVSILVAPRNAHAYPEAARYLHLRSHHQVRDHRKQLASWGLNMIQSNIRL